MPDCFIIMPITTPESFAPLYSGDKLHFQHVLGLSTRAMLPQGNESKGDKIELLTLQVEGLIRKMDNQEIAKSLNQPSVIGGIGTPNVESHVFHEMLIKFLRMRDLQFSSISSGVGNQVKFQLTRPKNKEILFDLTQFCMSYGYTPVYEFTSKN